MYNLNRVLSNRVEDLDSVRKMTERNFSLQYLNAENRRFNGSSSYRENSRKIRRILKNEKYKGDVLQGKTYTTDPITHKRVVNMGEENMYYIKEHHQAIIEPELFDKVQQILEKRAGSREKEKLNSKINKLIDLRLDNAIDRDTFLDRKEKLQAQIEQLNMKQEKLMLDERNNTNRKLSLNKIRKFFETGDIVTEFDKDAFEILIKQVIVGGNDEKENADPHAITFVLKNDNIINSKEYLQTSYNVGKLNLQESNHTR